MITQLPRPLENGDGIGYMRDIPTVFRINHLNGTQNHTEQRPFKDILCILRVSALKPRFLST